LSKFVALGRRDYIPTDASFGVMVVILLTAVGLSLRVNRRFALKRILLNEWLIEWSTNALGGR
jgi:hypothetical protein